MPEIPCPTCSGSGQQSIPTASLGPNDEPQIIMVITTCNTCKGNGKVHL